MDGGTNVSYQPEMPNAGHGRTCCGDQFVVRRTSPFRLFLRLRAHRTLVTQPDVHPPPMPGDRRWRAVIITA
jgi:hypothetical protein